MNKLDKDTMRKYIIQLAEQAESSGMAHSSYVEIMLKKLYALFGLRSGGPSNSINHNQEIDEWLELMAFCEMMALCEFYDLPSKERTDDKFKSIYKKTQEIRDGKVNSQFRSQ